MTLEYLILRDFQRHRQQRVDFDPLFTVIVGRNGAGKSATLRALEWICLNQPSGDEFIRIGAKSARVKLGIDGHVIRRAKGKGINTYALDGKTLAAFGAGKVPASVADLVNVDAFNFQGQLDEPFWFTATPGEVSREFNRVVAIDVIDRTLYNVASAVKRHKSRISVSEERLGEARRSKQHLRWVVDADKSLRKLEQQDKLLNKRQQDMERLASLLAQADTSRVLASQKNPDLSSLDALHEQITKTETKRQRLADLLSEALALENTICQAKHDGEIASEFLQKMTKGRCPICGNATGPAKS